MTEFHEILQEVFPNSISVEAKKDHCAPHIFFLSLLEKKKKKIKGNPEVSSGAAEDEETTSSVSLPPHPSFRRRFCSIPLDDSVDDRVCHVTFKHPLALQR